MKTFLMLLTIGLRSMATSAQPLTGVEGVYSLRGVSETASGFQLNKDSTFEFFYSYGALDRYGSGKWTLKNNEVILNSRPDPGKAFKLVKSALTATRFTTVKVAENNPVFFRFIYCLVRTKKGDTLLNANHNGIIYLHAKTDSIRLFFELAPEKKSSFAVNSKKSNSYTFQFEPWIVEVFLKDFSLHYQHGNLTGKHPLLGEEREYEYEKEN